MSVKIRPSTHEYHFEPIDLTDPALPRIGYDPGGPFGIDTSPFGGYNLRRWRRRQLDPTPYADHLSQEQAARQFGVSPSGWRGWEEGIVRRGWAPLIREWIRDHREWTICRDPVEPRYVRGLAAHVGGYADLAEAIGAYPSTVRDWGADWGPVRRHGMGTDP